MPDDYRTMTLSELLTEKQRLEQNIITMKQNENAAISVGNALETVKALIADRTQQDK
jgi:hypothetical protein